MVSEKILSRLIRLTSKPRSAATAVTLNVEDAALAALQQPRSLETMPRPKGMCPIFGSALATAARYRSDHGHRMIAERIKTLGKVYYDKILGYKSVNVASPADVATVYRNDAKHPERPEFTAWKYSRTRLGMPVGLVLAEGDQWYNYRKSMDNQMLVLSNLYKYVGSMNEIAADYLQVLLKNQSQNPDGYIVDLKHEQFRWALEFTYRFLYDKRLGCLRSDGSAPPKDILEFFNAIATIFDTSLPLSIMSTTTARILAPITLWKHNRAWGAMLAIARKHINAKIDELTKAQKEGRLEEAIAGGGFLWTILEEQRKGGDNKLHLDEIYSNVSELMFGGVDTTSTAAQWLFHLLALNPEKQERLHKEVLHNSKLVDGDAITPDILAKHCVYLRACLKEALRMRPILMGTARQLGKDSVINGYALPKGTPINILDYAMSTNEEYFKDAHKFVPERWLNDGEQSTWKTTANRFASLPFGFGARMCIGRRMAETQIFVLTSRIVRDYEIVDGNGGRMIEPSAKLLLVPSEPIKIRLEKRI